MAQKVGESVGFDGWEAEVEIAGSDTKVSGLVGQELSRSGALCLGRLHQSRAEKSNSCYYTFRREEMRNSTSLCRIEPLDESGPSLKKKE